MSDSKRYLISKGIKVDLEIFAPGLSDEGKDRVHLSTLLEMYAEQERNKAYRKATKIAQKNYKYGEFTITKKILKNASDYPDVGYDWEK